MNILASILGGLNPESLSKLDARDLDPDLLTVEQQQVLGELYVCACVQGTLTLEKLVSERCEGGKKRNCFAGDKGGMVQCTCN